METPKTYTAEEIIAMVRDEYQTWHGSYRPVVKVALEHLIIRISPYEKLETGERHG